jgi:lipopolysaccharide export system protein LptC
MSQAALDHRNQRRRWAARGGRHDVFMRFLRYALPVAMGALVAVLVIAPLSVDSEMSFLLAKDNVARANERLRVTTALYRGQDGKGQFFTLAAASAVQRTSQVPVVELQDLVANIQLPEGPASLNAAQGDYNMDTETISSNGAIRFQTADGYSLTANGVDVRLKGRTMESNRGVTGTLPIGTFSAQSIRADLQSRTVILEGGVRLRIYQGKL